VTIGAAQQFFLGASKATGGGAAGYQIERSLRFNSSDSGFCSRTPAVAGSQTTYTFSAWIKRSKINTEQIIFARGNTFISFDGADKIYANHRNGATNYFRISTAVYRDPSAWCHIVWAVDTTNATAQDRARIWFNNVEITVWAQNGTIPPNHPTEMNTTAIHALGRELTYGQYGDFYLADIHFIDGQALTPSSFTEVSATTGQLIPKAYTGTFGTNGFWLKFSDNSAATAATLGKDYSGNNNDWTPNNLSINTGGPTSVAAASGALPVYNTTDTYGTVKGTGTRTDTNSASIVLALPMDGTNGGTSFGDQSAVIKGSGSAKTVTATSTTTSTSQYKFYGSSGSFDGTNSILTIANDADFSFGTTDFTVECWVYLTSFAGANGARMVMSQGGAAFNDGAGWSLLVTSTGTVGAYVRGGTAVSITSTNAVSLNAWGHIALCKDANGTSLYINGILGAFSATSPGSVSSGSPFYIGRSQGSGGEYFGRYQGFINDVRIYKGVAKYTGNFNPPTATIIGSVAAANDSLVDTPTSFGTDTGVGGEVRGNYCTWNPLNKGSDATLANGNLDMTSISSAGNTLAVATLGLTSGKWYWEITCTGADPRNGIGIAKHGVNLNSWLGSDALGWSYVWGGQKGNNGSQSSYGASFTANDVIGIAFDADNGTLTFYKNGSSQGQAFSGLTSGPYFPAIADDSGGGVAGGSLNAGARPFAYTAPSGFKALCDTNLGAPLVAKPNELMNVVLYTGDGADNHAITGFGFSPEFLWVKARSAAYDHMIHDIVRGTTVNLRSNSTASEEYNTSNISSFDPDGFTTNAGSGYMNGIGQTFVAWGWDAGTTTDPSNQAGSITSQVRANVSAGFSVVTYTGVTGNQSFGHGLGVNPKLIMIKNRSNSANWFVMVDIGTTYYKYGHLNTTDAFADATAQPVTSTTVTLGNNNAWFGANGDNYVAYCFAPVVGYSSFGSYVGNGSSDGPMVYTGFRPRWIMTKVSSSGIGVDGDWLIVDTTRNQYNVADKFLFAQTASSEATTTLSDVLSNGFKIRSSLNAINASGLTYIYMAFAESPFQYARAR